MLLSAAMLVMAKMLPKSTVMDIGPDFMPMCIGVMTFVLAAALAPDYQADRSGKLEMVSLFSVTHVGEVIRRYNRDEQLGVTFILDRLRPRDRKRPTTRGCSQALSLSWSMCSCSSPWASSSALWSIFPSRCLSWRRKNGEEKRMSFSCCSLTYCLPSWYFSCSATDSRLCCLQVSLPSTYRR